MHKMKDGTFVIEHVARGHWSALEREQKIKTLAAVDSKVCVSYEVVVEQEPGSGGKESAENTIRNLAGYRVSADKVTGKKEIRAEPFVAQCQGDNVRLIAGEWVMHFLDECEVWPQSKRKDQVDAAAGAFNKLIAATAFDSSFSWVAEHEIALTLRHLPGESLISRARNNLVSQFLRTSCTHLMFIDADLAFEAASVGRMLDLDADQAVPA